MTKTELFEPILIENRFKEFCCIAVLYYNMNKLIYKDIQLLNVIRKKKSATHEYSCFNR